MRTASFLTAAVLLCVFVQTAFAEAVLETDNLRLVISDNATLKSLAAKPGGSEYAAASAATEPIAKVFRGDKEFPATAVKLDGSRMTVRFEGAGVEVVFEVTAKKEYIAVKLASLSGEPVDSIEFMRLAIKKLPQLGYWINAAYDDRFGVCLCAGNTRTDALMSPRALTIDESRPEVFDAMAVDRLAKRDQVVMRAFAEMAVGLEGATAVLFGFPRPQGITFLDPNDPFLDVMEIVERDFDMPPGAKFRRDPMQSASWIEVSGADAVKHR